jgi:D-alanine-D-alanine ligase
MTDYTRRAFMVCGCRGLARVDFFLCPDGTIYLNEINTMPWFTAISLYPKLMEYDGIDKIALVHRLIQSAKTVAKK